MSLSYLEFIKQHSLDARIGINPEIGQFVLDNKVKTLFGYFPFGYYLLDYHTQKFEFINNSESLLGYTMDYFLLGGLPASLKNFHPDDFVIFSEKLFPDIIKFFSELRSDDRDYYRVTYNYRYKKKDRTYIHLQQHSTFTDFNLLNLPTRNFALINDISACKRDNALVLTITRVKEGKEMLVLQKRFNHEKPSIFTDREKEILDLAMKGYTGKEIAGKLFISLNTVRNHKQNMMEKTNTPNIASLIDYAFKSEVV